MRRTDIATAVVLSFLVLACGPRAEAPGAPDVHAVGPHGARLLTSGAFALEIGIFEGNAPPQLRAWATLDGKPVPPASVALHVRLERLGGRVDEIGFAPHDGYLRGDSEVGEPHSFEVSVEAEHAGQRHAWSYALVEGRTRIAPEMGASLGIETAVAGPAVLKLTRTLHGRVRPNPERVREIRARFDGAVRAVRAEVGSRVAKGDPLLTIESDESLNAYVVRAPISGIVTQRDANPGEQTHGRLLLTVTDPSSVWVDLAVFPADRTEIRVGSPVEIAPATGGAAVAGVISVVELHAREDQSVVARAVLEESPAHLLPGTFVTAAVTVGEQAVPLAVERRALQTFRGLPAVFARFGETYEVRVLELGLEAVELVEVRSGLDPGTPYVTANSYVIKAEIEKSGAAHGH
jgi:cobalt-zinc-cadmium efflux system membrane fusion protein